MLAPKIALIGLETTEFSSLYVKNLMKLLRFNLILLKKIGHKPGSKFSPLQHKWSLQVPAKYQQNPISRFENKPNPNRNPRCFGGKRCRDVLGLAVKDSTFIKLGFSGGYPCS
jgi:hypothetical protein